MTYQYTDIILCFPGIGRTFFEKGKTEAVDHSSFTINFDESAKAETLLCARATKKYRYVLAPISDKLRKELNAKGIPYLLVAPNPNDKQIWIKRWLKAGGTAEMIAARISEWGTIGTQYGGEPEWIYLAADEWLGNILQQSPISEGDGKDV